MNYTFLCERRVLGIDKHSIMILSTLTVYFLLLRIYPVIAVKDTEHLMIHESSYENVIQDGIATGEYDASEVMGGKDRVRGTLHRKNFIHAKKDQVNNNRNGAKRVKKGKKYRYQSLKLEI